jgi:hypothetical protein
MTIKTGNCYIASFTKNVMPIRIESREANGHWKARSLTHGRIVFVKTEAQLIRECNPGDLAEYAKTVVPNRRSKRQPPPPVRTLAVETPHVAPVRKIKVKRQSVPEYSLNALDAAHRVLKEAKKPLTCQEIVDRAIQRKFWRTEGATPQNSLNAAIARDIKANAERSRFIKTGRGLFSAR